VTENPRLARWKEAGSRSTSSIRCGTARSFPILHLNGYKISGPTVQGRTSDEDLKALYIGRGYKPYFVEGDDPEVVHQLLAGTLDDCYAEIRAIQQEARKSGFKKQPIWPMIVLRTPKGWTCPKKWMESRLKAPSVRTRCPLATVRENPEHLKILEAWMRSYKPQELFDENGKFIDELAELAPAGNRRMGGNPHVNGGRLLTALDLPDFTNYALEIPGPGQVVAEAPRKLGDFFRDIFKLNPTNFRMFCPDETNSNRLNSVLEATKRCFMAETVSIDDELSPDGRVMEVLSEHCCQGWLEGYLLTGPAWHVVFLRSFRASRGFDADATRQMAGAMPRFSLAQTARILKCSADKSCMAKRSQRFQPSGDRICGQCTGAQE
jgi:xylulose-5-phosphate/fructose-6-phosphate phosphoketolase